MKIFDGSDLIVSRRICMANFTVWIWLNRCRLAGFWLNRFSIESITYIVRCWLNRALSTLTQVIGNMVGPWRLERQTRSHNSGISGQETAITFSAASRRR
jgi:hypothetical protein